MKRRIWVVGGSIGAVVLLVLAMVSTIVSARVVESKELRSSIIHSFRDKIADSFWAPGDIIFMIRLIIFAFILMTTAFFSGHYG